MRPITGPEDGASPPPAGGGAARKSRLRPLVSWSAVWAGLKSTLVLRVLLLTIAGFGGGYVFATRVLFPAPPVSESLIEMPSWSDVPLDEAVQGIQALGLTVSDVDSVKHPSAPEGTVFGQSPLSGQLAEPGGPVRLTVSSGPQLYAVPDVSGIDAAQAISILEAAGFEHSIDSVESGRPRGTVLETTPDRGDRVALPTQVALAVSMGPAMVVVPRLLGLTEEQAVDSLRTLGLRVGEIEVRFRFGLDQGRVVEQEPASGREVEEGSTVRLVVGRRGGSEETR